MKMNLWKNMALSIVTLLLAVQLCQAEIKYDPYPAEKELFTIVKGGKLSYEWDLEASVWCSHEKEEIKVSQKKSAEWDVTTGVPLNEEKEARPAEIKHPTGSYAKAIFTATSTKLPSGSYKVEGKISCELDVFATAEADFAVNPCEARATSAIKMAKMKLGDKISSIHDLHGSATVVSRKKGDPRWHTGEIFKPKRFKDPVTLSLIEVETGQMWTETLFELNIDMDDYGGGAFTFDNDLNGEGVFLSCDIDENIRIYGGSSSDWLAYSYGEFSASLSDGLFTATGAWAALPWTLTYEDPTDITSNVLSAYLSSDYLFSNLEWQIPETLIREGYTYNTSLDWSEYAYVEDTDVDFVPEPATMLLLALGGVMAMRKRRV